MRHLAIDKNTLTTVTTLAHLLQISEKRVVQKAIRHYANELRKFNRLQAFAGILEEAEADEMLKTIQNSRLNKSWEIEL